MKHLNVNAACFVPNVTAAIFAPPAEEMEAIVPDSGVSDIGMVITELPNEVLLEVFSLLRYRDLISVGRTCKRCHELSKDDMLLQKTKQKEAQRILITWPYKEYHPSKKEVGLAHSLCMYILN